MKVFCCALLAFLLLPAAANAQEATGQQTDPAMEAKLNDAWSEVRAYFERRREGDATEGDDPQWAYAKEFFQYYLEHPDMPTGREAGETAFVMWGNVGAADEVDRAVPQISDDSEIWSRILNSIGNAFARNDRSEDYFALLLRLQDDLSHPKSRSELLLTLARHFSSSDESGRAKEYYEEVIRLEAHPFDVQRAESAMYELTSLNVGQTAPDFTVDSIDGEWVTLSEQRGKVVLLEFWATSCGPCLPEIPHLKAMHERFPESDFQIIGITEDEDLEALTQFLEERKMTWLQVQQLSRFEDEVLIQDEVLTRYNVYRIPRSFLIDRDGTIAAKDLRGDELEEVAGELIAGDFE